MSTHSNPETILAIETTLSGGSLALRHGSAVFTDAGSVSRSEGLLPAIDSLLKKASLDIRDVTVVAASLGPGSFTGIRIGVATALGIEASCGAACFGITTTEAVASTCPDVDRYAVVAVGRSQYSVQYFQAGKIEATLPLDFNVIDENDLCERTIGHSQNTFVFANEMDPADFAGTILPTDMPNSIISAKPTAELMCDLVANGHRRSDLTPIYARPDADPSR